MKKLTVKDDLFARAEEAARSVVYWRQQAEAVKATAQRSAIYGLTRRQCLDRARKSDDVIVNLAIRAEVDAERAMWLRAA